MMQKQKMLSRWDSERNIDGLKVLKGIAAESPFGTTSEGQADLRGIVVPSIRLDGVSLARFDLSYARSGELVLTNSNLSDSKLDHAELRLVDRAVCVDRVSFNHANMRAASLAGSGSRYYCCTFRRTNLIGLSAAEGEFEECRFEYAKWGSRGDGVYALCFCWGAE